MAVSDYSTTPAANVSINGINIGENCPAANVNNALRQMMADIAVFSAGISNGSSFMPKAGGAFTGNPTFSGKGGYLYNSSATATGGQVTFLPQGSGLPLSGTDGDMVVFYQ